MNARSKTLTELSPDAEQRFLVSHETSISQMTPLCPSYVPILSPFSVYQTHGDLSFAAENSKSPSRLMRTRVSALSCPFSDNGRITCKISHTHILVLFSSSRRSSKWVRNWRRYQQAYQIPKHFCSLSDFEHFAAQFSSNNLREPSSRIRAISRTGQSMGHLFMPISFQAFTKPSGSSFANCTKVLVKLLIASKFAAEICVWNPPRCEEISSAWGVYCSSRFDCKSPHVAIWFYSWSNEAPR